MDYFLGGGGGGERRLPSQPRSTIFFLRCVCMINQVIECLNVELVDAKESWSPFPPQCLYQARHSDVLRRRKRRHPKYVLARSLFMVEMRNGATLSVDEAVVHPDTSKFSLKHVVLPTTKLSKYPLAFCSRNSDLMSVNARGSGIMVAEQPRIA